MIQPRHSRHDFIISLFKKSVLFLFVCAPTFTQFLCHIFAEGETARLDVVTWDGTTECGSISLDGGEYGASAGGDYDQSSISLHTVRIKPAYGYYFRGRHVGNSDTAARNSPLSKIENPYSFSFGYNLDVANAPYYLIADFAPIGTEYDEYIDPSTLNGSNWMSGVSGDRLLNEIIIPGTHDSLCKNVWCAHWFGSKFEYGAITQNLDLEDRLNAGVRLPDIRLTNESNGLNQYDPNGLRLCHGSYKALGLDLLYF